MSWSKYGFTGVTKEVDGSDKSGRCYEAIVRAVESIENIKMGEAEGNEKVEQGQCERCVEEPCPVG